MEPWRGNFGRKVSDLARELPLVARKRPNASNPQSRILDGLNPAQRTAVTTPAEILQILAPPGSGKTRTLTSRVAYLLSEPNCLNPENVIVATFTVKAANEMKQRLAALVGAGVERRLLLGTFHSIARRYLIKYGYLIGLSSSWGIADAADTKAICQRIIKRRGLKDTIDPRTLQSRISHFKARNLTPQANASPVCHSTQPSTQQTKKQEKNLANEDFIMLYEDYHESLDASNLLDYDDLLLRCLEMIKQHPQCVSNVEAVLIDEFQDTNIVQYELMRKFAWKAKRITIVGDPDQSIYGFRAAEIGNLRRMRAFYSDTLVVNLEENYRSSASILTAALEVIKQDAGRHDKPLTPTHAIGPSPVLRRVPTPALEASWIVGEIRRLRATTAGVIQLNGIAILVRSSPLTRNIETALAREGVSYKMVGGTRFFDRAEVKIVLDYLRVLQNPANNDALMRVVNVPSRKIGDVTLKALLEEAEKKKRTLWDLMCKGVRGDVSWGVKIGKQAETGLGAFTALMLSIMGKLDEQSQDSNLAQIVETLLAKLNYGNFLQRTYPEDFEGRWANVQEVISQAREIVVENDEEYLPEIEGLQQQNSPQTPRLALERFLANAALVNERRQEEQDGGEGLEWPVVFIPAVYEGSIPHSRAEDTDEERRLLYVAMTRAQGLLYMSCPYRSGTTDKTKLSTFVNNPLVERLLSKKASDLPFTAVQTLAHILSAKCPSEREIEASIEKSGIVSRHDDQITDKDPVEEEAKRKAELEIKNHGGGQRQNHYDGPVKFQSARNLNVNSMTTEERMRQKLTTAEKIGFRSANNHLSELKKIGLGDVTCEADGREKEKRQIHNSMMGTNKSVTTAPNDLTTFTTAMITKKTTRKVSAGGQKAPTGSVGQGTLTTFFKKKPPPEPKKQPTATEVVKKLRTSTMTLKEQMDSLPIPLIPKRAAGDFILLSSSPPRPKLAKKQRVGTNKNEIPIQKESVVVNMKSNIAVDNSLRPKVPVFPNSPEFQDFCELIDQSNNPNTAAETIAPEIEMEDADEICLPPLAAEPSVSVVTETASSVGSLKASHAGGISLRGRGTTKRTLGIRRSMNGWQNRGGIRGSK
ncbi:P-loop containing nucleoside triphosphate hydrolase protein [Geopyxis carbonaria]|nr:P-loop containing nucleoside triphosphate hydrolase protein [Geopyxis carbonaria]